MYTILSYYNSSLELLCSLHFRNHNSKSYTTNDNTIKDNKTNAKQANNNKTNANQANANKTNVKQAHGFALCWKGGWMHEHILHDQVSYLTNMIEVF